MIAAWPRSLKIGLAVLVAIGLVALLAPWIAPYDPLQQEIVNKLASPSSAHLLGTDNLGRDVFSRLIHAARIDLTIGLLGALLPFVVGSVVGLVAGYFGGWVDSLMMRIADVVQVFPLYVLIIALVFAFGPGAKTILVAFTLVAWVVYARLVRAEVLRVRQLDYVAAARSGGLSTWRVMSRHVAPNAMSQALVYAMSDIVQAVLALATFSFLGLGIPAPTPEWGAMIADGQRFVRAQWWLSTAPGLVVVVFGIALSLLGDGVAERIGES